ncbi:hydroxyisourate hydrolase [Pedobacter gandavensis]|uniref:5-hydroxyisourate hydrolase n=1 Tax=Pedobacter gandavensis TaxID=2679963 RepID=A0ABR6ET63_9SPHI|nr:hydroxyisourate hydrolase [Pedobacter gandavensis]MBB2148171.1 hydroxyisourate hydrolase [Pedobacter gandavensis]
MLKKLSILILLVGFTFSGIAQSQKFQLSSHILDISRGLPAQGVLIRLEKQNGNKQWTFIAENKTNQQGRIQDFLPYGNKGNKGIFKLTYFIEPYFKSLKQNSFYPFIEVVFEIKDDQHYHVPITLSPYGYSTYRGN